MFRGLNTEKPSRNTAKAHKHHKFKKNQKQQDIFFYSQYIFRFWEFRWISLRKSFPLEDSQCISRSSCWFVFPNFLSTAFTVLILIPVCTDHKHSLPACAQLVRNGGAPLGCSSHWDPTVPPSRAPLQNQPWENLHRAKEGALESEWDLIQWENK